MSDYEIATDAALREAAARRDVRVCPKVRLSDALDLRSSGLSKRDFDYARCAHLDFVVVGDPDGKTHFAVEFDGWRHHYDATTARRDEIKNRVCRRLGLPLLRIGAEYLRRVGRYTVVGWLVEFWYLQEAFYEAQDRGEVPWDEPFIYFGFFEPNESGRLEPFSLDGPGWRILNRAASDGILSSYPPEYIHPEEEKDGYALCHALVGLRGGNTAIGTARCRSIAFPGITAAELAFDLAINDVAEKVRDYQHGTSEGIGPNELRRFRERTKAYVRHGVPLNDHSDSRRGRR